MAQINSEALAEVKRQVGEQLGLTAADAMITIRQLLTSPDVFEITVCRHSQPERVERYSYKLPPGDEPVRVQLDSDG